MAALIALWSHLLAALLYAMLALWQVRRVQLDRRNWPLAAAFAVLAAWSLFMGLLGPEHVLSGLTDGARHIAFLSFMYSVLSGSAETDRQRGVKLVYAAVAAAVGLQIVIAGALPEFRPGGPAHTALLSTWQMIGLTVSAGALILVHNFYVQAAPGSRWSIRLPAAAMAVMWAYDLHLYTVSYFSRTPSEELFAFRGAVLALLVPLFAIGLRRSTAWRVQLSRAATFQSLSLLGIFAYLMVMMSAAPAIEASDGGWAAVAQVSLIFMMTAAALVLLPSGKARAWLYVIVAKHFFEHRYDYRAEWLRFTRTVGLERDGDTSIDERVVKALAELGGAGAGLLLVADDKGRLSPSVAWNCTAPAPAGVEDDGSYARFAAAEAHVLAFDEIRDGAISHRGRSVPVPAWIAGIEKAWAGIPLIHCGRLVGLIVLCRPHVRRTLDWEDFDLFRAAGTQAASFLAEARSQQALADAQRFDEFNRRFAFIMHDIKNLVSQISLVARNAERHADNPDFRADMIVTLQESVKKMNALLARLSRGRPAEGAPPRPTNLRALLTGLAERKARAHPVELSADPRLAAYADPEGLEHALSHLVQNAIEASPAGRAVGIRVEARGGEIGIEIADRGCGMSPDFLRSRLFQPFASTKESGFGVGAHEARALVQAMGGRLEVESAEGQGSRFTIFLPRAAMAADQESRLSA